MQQFISSHYALRVNLLRRQTEYAVINPQMSDPQVRELNPQVREPNPQVREPNLQVQDANPQVREPNLQVPDANPQVPELISEPPALHYEVLDDMALNTIFFELRRAGIRPFDEQEPATPLTARQIFDTVSQKHPRLVLGMRLCDFSKQLTSLFATTPKKHDGLRYYAVPLRLQV